MATEPHVLCPICRQAVPDREYYAHAKRHQEREAQAQSESKS